MILTSQFRDKVDVSDVKISKETKLLGSLRPPLGHSVFELNLETLEIKLAQFENVTVDYKQNQSVRDVRKKLLIRKKCMYVSALNMENANRKFLKSLTHA